MEDARFGDLEVNLDWLAEVGRQAGFAQGQPGTKKGVGQPTTGGDRLREERASKDRSAYGQCGQAHGQREYAHLLVIFFPVECAAVEGEIRVEHAGL